MPRFNFAIFKCFILNFYTGRLHIKEMKGSVKKEMKTKHTCNKQENTTDQTNELSASQNGVSRSENELKKTLTLTNNAIQKREKAMVQLISNCPHLTLWEYYNNEINLLENNYVFSLSKIDRIVSETKATLYPKQPEIAFSGFL